MFTMTLAAATFADLCTNVATLPVAAVQRATFSFEGSNLDFLDFMGVVHSASKASSLITIADFNDGDTIFEEWVNMDKGTYHNTRVNQGAGTPVESIDGATLARVQTAVAGKIKAYSQAQEDKIHACHLIKKWGM